MKFSLLPTVGLVLGMFSSALAQDGKGTAIRPLESGGGSSIVAPTMRPPKVIIVTHNAVSPSRQWMDDQGRTMVGRLLAFSVPEEGKPGAIEVIREETIRFLRSGADKPIDFPLSKMSAEDQAYIREIAKATAKAATAKAAAPAKPETPAHPAPAAPE